MKAIYFCMILSISIVPTLGTSFDIILTCTNNNPFIKKLWSVKKLAAPNFNNPECAEEWNLFGSCCEVSDLKKFASEDEKVIAAALTWAETESPLLLGAVRDSFDLIKVIAHLPNSPNETHVNLSADQARTLLSHKQILTKYELLLSVLDSDSSRWKDEHSRCWNAVASQRSSVLCKTCSGRSNKFFLESKAVVSEGFCNDFAALCMDSLKKLFLMVETVMLLEEAVLRMELYGLESNFRKKIDLPKLNALKTQMSSQNLFYEQVRNLNSTDDSSTKFCCSKFLRLSQPTVLQEMTAIFMNNLAWHFHLSNDISKYYELHKVEVDTAANCWKLETAGSSATSSNWTIGRILQIESSPSSFESDTITALPTGTYYGNTSTVANGQEQEQSAIDPLPKFP